MLTPLGDKFTAISPPGSRGFITTKESTHPSGCKALSSTSLPSNSTPPRRPRHLTQLSTICGQPQSGGTTRPGCPHRWATAHRTRSTPNGPPPPLSHPLWRRKPRKNSLYETRSLIPAQVHGQGPRWLDGLCDNDHLAPSRASCYATTPPKHPLPILLTRPNDPYPQPGSHVATHSRLGRAVLPSIYCNSLPRRVV